MVCFDIFVRSAIARLSGIREIELPLPSVEAKLSRNLNAAPGRRDVIRVKLLREHGGFRAEPILGKSGSISTLSRAHGYFLIEEDSQGVTENTVINVYLYE
jgi:molybdopterin molybdotransferase